jgi:methylated-DNA-[protein]-cysteine S-methyltransferase
LLQNIFLTQFFNLICYLKGRKMGGKYTIFETEWGYFGLFGTDNAVFRSCLPMDTKERVIDALLGGVDDAIVDNRCFSDTVKLVKAYYKGDCVDFSRVRIGLDSKTEFARAILTALHKVKYGRVVSYGELAKMAGKNGASRAVGTVMAKNDLPLIIPCHRVLRSDGKIGGFSAAGGATTKQRMLDLESKPSIIQS